MECVVVEAGARLHLGFYNFYNPERGLAYGSVGVGVEWPRVVVRVCRGGGVWRVPREALGDVEFLRRRGLLGGDASVDVVEVIERHVGLGSTTQLRLSIAYAYSLLSGRPRDVYEIALLAGRGFVSGVGIEVFRGGGLVVDSGRRAPGGVLGEPVRVEDLPRAIARIALPRDWAFILVRPEAPAGPGEGGWERRVMEAPKPAPAGVRCRLYEALLALLEAGRRGDLEGFGRALSELDAAAGEYFARVGQGGRYCCWETGAAVEELVRAGGLGAGQSSWGPVAYAVASADDAGRVAGRVVDGLAGRGVRVRWVRVVGVRNYGAVVRWEEG